MKLIATIALASLSFPAVSADGCTIGQQQFNISTTQPQGLCCLRNDGSKTWHLVAKIKSVDNDDYSVKAGASNDANYCGDSPPTWFDEEEYNDNFEHTYDHMLAPVGYSNQSIVLMIFCHNLIEDCQISLDSTVISSASARVTNSTRSNIEMHRSHDVNSDDCISGMTCSSTGTFDCDQYIKEDGKKYCCCPTGGNLCTSASACQGESTPKDQSDLGMRRFGGSKSMFNRTLKF